MSRTIYILPLLLLLAACGAYAQDQGPEAPPPEFKVNRIPALPHPGPPPIPAEQIIQKFAGNEDAMKRLYESYAFKQTVRIEELGDPGGKFVVSGDVYTKPDGERFWRVEQTGQSTLKISSFSLEDVRAIISMPWFIFTTDEIGNYNFLYVGQDKLDELNTYVFQVKPKQLSRTRKYFDGVIWIDDHDLAIVKTYGKFVSELVGTGEKYPFTMFETYRENFDDKYWLPTYTVSDEYVPQKDDEPLHLRLVIRETDFKQQAGNAASETAGAPSAPPAVPNSASPK